MSTTNTMIPLLASKPFAVGGRRECYVHPENRDWCIKVHRPEFHPALLRKRVPWWRSIRKNEYDFDENVSDWKVLAMLASDPDTSMWSHLPGFHGWAETDRGRGLVVGLIRDANGLISRTLLDWIWQNGPAERLDAAIDTFCKFWEKRTIPSRSLGLHNIVVREEADGSCRLVVIDGLGDTQFIPFSKISRQYALRRSASKTARLRREILELIESRKNREDPGKRGFLLSRE
jgi:hypothetical protein